MSHSPYRGMPEWMEGELRKRMERNRPLASSPPPGPGVNRWLAAALAAVVLLTGGWALNSVLTDDQQPSLESGRPQVTTAPSGPVRGRSNEPVAEIARALLPSVVQIETGAGLGSGVVYDADGFILTAAHVVQGATEVTVRLGNGSQVSGEVVGADNGTDVAVVRVDASSSLTPATLGVGSPVQVGQLAVAIGSPFGLQQTVTSGIVSAVGRTIVNGNGNPVAMIQTDASINPGNSGGALADRAGRVIGSNDAIRSESGVNSGVGFAIPIDTAVQVADALVSGRKPQTGFLGVSLQDPTSGPAGALVTEVHPDTAADRGGIRRGDLVTRFDGRPVASGADLSALVQATEPGTEVEIEILRSGQTETLTARIGNK
ncbi:MAG: S1C family serine protease [Actinomycetota bacterium]